MSDFTRILKKIRPYTIKKGFLYLKHYGPKEFMVRLKERTEPEEVPYGPWYEKHAAGAETLAKQAAASKNAAVKISVAVPAFKTPEKYLREMIESLQNQSYPNWELCIANASPEEEEMAAVLKEYAQKDSRIRVKDLEENIGIAENTNRAMELATGDYIGLLDHDDLLAPDALYEVAKAIKEKQADVVYTDEDKVDEHAKEHTQPHLKPDFNIDLLRSNNYITHFFVAKKELFEKTGGFRKGFDGAQDHDLIFRCCEQADVIAHVPRILYHWRTHSASTADNPASKLYAYEAGRRAIEGNLERSGLKGEVSLLKDYGFFRVKYELSAHPLVSILIPTKDHTDILDRCLKSIREKTTYDNCEIILIENNSTEEETFRYYERLMTEFGAVSQDAAGETGENPFEGENGRNAGMPIRIVTWEGTFNFSAINNFGARFASGEYLVFLNNDIEIITPDWIEELLSNAMRPEVGAVGCKLYYPDHTIQHAGVIVGLGGIAGHAFLGLDGRMSGYLHKASIQYDVSAVTAAAMMMPKAVFEEAGGFEEKLAVAFNDIDLCLKVREKNYLIVYDPFCEMTHHESKTRGAEDTDEKARRFYNEIEYMRTRWAKILKNGDPNYNPNLTLSKWNYSLKAEQ